MNYTGFMEYAEDIAGAVNICGILICLAGIGFGVSVIVRETIRLYSLRRVHNA